MQNRTKFITYLSPAKLNLGLKVVGKRPDGYHLLKTIFCLIDLFDVMHIQIINTPQISLIEHMQAWPYNKDLAYKAAKLLQEATDCRLGVNIKVNKVIPSGAGLGGGSSNAATILVALNHLWQLNLPTEKLIELGRILGADVPFFIHGKNAYATGIGDEFTDLTLPEKYYVLVKPAFHIPTRDIFKALTIGHTDTNLINSKTLLQAPENDLQPVAEQLYPGLKKILKDLSNLGNPIMTGSGSVVFLQFDEQKDANKVALELGKSYNTYLVKSIDVSPIFTSY